MTKTLAIDWKVKKAKLSDLKEWVKNPRKLTAEAYEELLKSIKRDGFHDVLKIDVDGTILSGHQRKRALTELGIEEINVMYPDRKLTEKEMELVSLKSNRHEGTFDFDMLGNMFDIDTLLEAGFQPFEFGFDTSDLGSTKETEVNFTVLEKDLNCECPKCHFKFKQNV